MKPPIIVNENGDISIFELAKDAQLYLEPIDVENNEYVAYDSEGRLLRLIATSPRITIEDAESEPKHASELRDVLVDFFARIGVSADWLSKASLRELVAKGLEYKTK